MSQVDQKMSQVDQKMSQHVDQLLKDLDKIKDPAVDITEFKHITELMASGKVEYTYPYPLKSLLIKYAGLVQQVLNKQAA
jgi:hypothetical protein